MKALAIIIVVLGAAGCAGPSVATADGPIAADTALLGETRSQRSLADYDWLLVGGVDKPWRFIPPTPWQQEKNRFHRVPAGKRTIYARVWATARRGLPGVRDDMIKFENVELEGGKAYIINGERNGEVFDVWIEDYRTREHVTSAVKIKPPRHGMPGGGGG
jgi:hypothetical protein